MLSNFVWTLLHLFIWHLTFVVDIFHFFLLRHIVHLTFDWVMLRWLFPLTLFGYLLLLLVIFIVVVDCCSFTFTFVVWITVCWLCSCCWLPLLYSVYVVGAGIAGTFVIVVVHCCYCSYLFDCCYIAGDYGVVDCYPIIYCCCTDCLLLFDYPVGLLRWWCCW